MSQLFEPACDRERVALIFNPASGPHSAEARRATLGALTHTAQLTCPLVETSRERGAAPLAQEAVAHGTERLLVCGGDGSVMEAAGALAGTSTALAVIPGGTGNLLARNLGISTNMEAAMRLALTEEARPTDLGRANGEVFLIMAGMGVDARMIHDADRQLKHRFGILAYFIAALRNLRRTRVLYQISLDGCVLRRHAQTVLVVNMGHVTGGVELIPDASPEDGTLEVAILRTRRLRDLVTVALRAMIGRTRSDTLLEIHQARHVVIETQRPQRVELDGNEVESTRRLEVRVEPGALLLVRPERADAVTPSQSTPAPRMKLAA